MAITFKDVLKLAKAKNATIELNSVVFDGKSAMTANQMDWVVGVPCPQPALTEPVVVPVAAILMHLAKSRHLVVMPDHLSNGQGLVTPFNKPKRWDDAIALYFFPKPPQGDEVSFDLELDALDRVLIAASEHDVRYYLKGVLFDLTNGVLVGTNGHRLHVYRNRVPVVYPVKKVKGIRQGADVGLILPRGPLRWMLGSADQRAKMTIWNPVVKMVEGEPAKLPSMLLQTADGFVWIRKPVEGRFPDWTRVMPAKLSRPLSVEFDPVKFADAAGAMGRVVQLASKGKFHGVLVDFGKGMIATEAAPGGMPVPMVLHCKDATLDLAGLDDSLWIGVNASYLQDLADCVTPAARWYLDWSNCSNSSLMVVDGDFSGVVMPMRIGGPVKPEPAPMPQDGPQAAPDAVAAVLESIREQVADFEDVCPETPEPAPVSA
jgi:hypothetical protein